MKTAAYVRVSTLRQAQTQNIEQQIERIESYCEQNGLELKTENIFRDDGYSGADLRRPGLERLRDGARIGEFERILITTPDRLAREYVHQIILLEELESNGCTVEFLDRPMSQDPHDQLLLQIRGAVAEYERTLIAERMRRGRMTKLKAGTLLPFSRSPYGYEMDPDNPRDPSKLKINLQEAAIIKEIFTLYLEEGTLRSLAHKLHDRGIESPKGKEWWNWAALHGVLTNPIYIGEIYGGRTRVRPAKKRHSAVLPVGIQHRTSRPVPCEEWILVAHTEAIISSQEFAQVQEKLKQNKRISSRNNTVRNYLLRTLVYCGHCSLSCSARGGSSPYSYYGCNGRSEPFTSRQSKQCSVGKLIPAQQLDDIVWGDVVELLQHPEMIQQALEQAQNGAWLPQQLQSRKSQLKRGQATIRNQMERLTTAYLTEVLNIEEYQRRRRDLETQLKTLDRQLLELDAQSKHVEQLTEYASGIKHFASRISDTLGSASFEQKRQIVELLVDAVIVKVDHIEIKYVIPVSPAGEHTRFCHLCLDHLT